MSEVINLTGGSILTTAVLICDPVVATNGSPDAIPSRTLVGTQVVDAALELQSTQGGLLIPRMTTTQMNNLVTVNGMMIYNTTVAQFYAYQNGSWSQLGGSSGVTSITQGTNMSFSVSPITTTGTINLATTLTGLTSVAVGSLTLSTTHIASSGAILLQTNGTTTALTLDTSQNGTFAAGVLLTGSNTITLGSDAVGGSSFGPQILLKASSTRVMTIDINNTTSNACNISSTTSDINLMPSNSLNLSPGQIVLFTKNAQFNSSQNTSLVFNNSGAWVNTALSTAGAVVQVPAITYQDNSTATSGTNAGPACVWSFNTPTLTATNTGVTTTTACTVYIGGAPVASTNQTITNPYAFYVNGGISHFGGVVDFAGGTAATATAGSATLPANPVGFINVRVGGSAFKVPYYNT